MDPYLVSQGGQELTDVLRRDSVLSQPRSTRSIRSSIEMPVDAPITPPISPPPTEDNDSSGSGSHSSNIFVDANPVQVHSARFSSWGEPGIDTQMQDEESSDAQTVIERPLTPPQPPLRSLADEPPHLVNRDHLSLTDFEVLESLGQFCFITFV